MWVLLHVMGLESEGRYLQGVVKVYFLLYGEVVNRLGCKLVI